MHAIRMMRRAGTGDGPREATNGPLMPVASAERARQSRSTPRCVLKSRSLIWTTEVPQREHGLREPREIGCILEIESRNRSLAPGCQVGGLRGLADLTSTENGHDRKPRKLPGDRLARFVSVEHDEVSLYREDSVPQTEISRSSRSGLCTFGD